MIKIGITGGVGSGKSLITNYIGDNYNARVYLADDIANKIKEPGEICYGPIIDLLGEDILNDDKTIDKKAMAAKIFADPELLKKVNGIIHPAVKTYVLNEIKRLEDDGFKGLFVLEAALLIEDNYDEILDELWYVRVDEEIRIKRLMDSRGYSREKALSIMKKQLSDEEYRKHCKVVIDNSGSIKDTERSLQRLMEKYGG